MRKLVILAALLALGCHRAAPQAAPGAAVDASTPAGPDLCDQMIDHMFVLAEATGKLSFTQRMMMRGVKSQVVGQCRKEGLSQAQADCFLRVQKPEELKTIEDCPALKAHPLLWLSSGPADGGEPAEAAPTKL
jgi:hypothetical protein